MLNDNKLFLLDCTLRDGGYYNNWDFPEEVVNLYLQAMSQANIDIVELGLRSLKNTSFNGASAYTTDEYLSTLHIPETISVAVMVNASELLQSEDISDVLSKLFPNDAERSPASVVRIACHIHEFEKALPASNWLKDRGFYVGFNLMQIADRAEEEVVSLAKVASGYPVDVLYFADSMGSMNPAQTKKIIEWIRQGWTGAMGIHTHDNMGLALSNTLEAFENGVTWLDSTITGMGRGPGNARTEEIIIEAEALDGRRSNIVPLMSLISSFFQPMKNDCGWGSNPYYYLAGKYGIHPTYIQMMQADSRYSEEDILSTIAHLRKEGGKKFSLDTLDSAREFYNSEGKGIWSPKELFDNREVLILGTGPSVSKHKAAIESFISKKNLVVIALNTQSAICQSKIDVRIACHPVRLLADCAKHVEFEQPLITPASMLPTDVYDSLSSKTLLDYGLTIAPKTFEFGENVCTLPNALVMSYALATLTAGNSENIYIAGFDGYGADDPRNNEMNSIFQLYLKSSGAKDIVSVTPSRYDVEKKSIYGF